MNRNTPVKCAEGSRLIREFDYENVQDMIGVSLDDEALGVLEEIRMQKVVEDSHSRRVAKSKTLSEHFDSIGNKIERDATIGEALSDGYTQAEIAKYLGLSRSAVCKVMGKGK